MSTPHNCSQLLQILHQLDPGSERKNPDQPLPEKIPFRPYFAMKSWGFSSSYCIFPIRAGTSFHFVLPIRNLSEGSSPEMLFRRVSDFFAEKARKCRDNQSRHILMEPQGQAFQIQITKLQTDTRQKQKLVFCIALLSPSSRQGYSNCMETINYKSDCIPVEYM